MSSERRIGLRAFVFGSNMVFATCHQHQTFYMGRFPPMQRGTTTPDHPISNPSVLQLIGPSARPPSRPSSVGAFVGVGDLHLHRASASLGRAIGIRHHQRQLLTCEQVEG